jgi:hypothetical protein
MSDRYVLVKINEAGWSTIQGPASIVQDALASYGVGETDVVDVTEAVELIGGRTLRVAVGHFIKSVEALR